MWGTIYQDEVLRPDRGAGSYTPGAFLTWSGFHNPWGR